MKCKLCDNEASWIYVSDVEPSLCDKCVCRPCSCNARPVNNDSNIDCYSEVYNPDNWTND